MIYCELLIFETTRVALKNPNVLSKRFLHDMRGDSWPPHLEITVEKFIIAFFNSPSSLFRRNLIQKAPCVWLWWGLFCPSSRVGLWLVWGRSRGNTSPCFGHCWAVQAQHQGFLLSTLPPAMCDCWGWQRLGGDTSWARPSWAGQRWICAHQ